MKWWSHGNEKVKRPYVKRTDHWFYKGISYKLFLNLNNTPSLLMISNYCYVRMCKGSGVLKTT